MSTTPTTPSTPTPQEVTAAIQAQALEAIKAGQAATLDAIKKWNENVAQFSAGLPAAPEVPAEVKNAFGDPDQIVDSVYDFAAQLLELNKQFVHQLLDASAHQK